ncbi:MAG: hypothetical protein FJW30_01630 [Acidobacteria bacterium]|nr:hypothetical protein [Acidobacteriota bacterium]
MIAALLLPLLFQIRIDENQTKRVGHYTVRLTIPADPEVRPLGGSGGAMWDIHVIDRQTGRKIVFTEQVIWLDAMAMRTGPPVLFTWTKSSIDAYSRCRHEPRGKTYVMTLCEDYEPGEDGKLQRTKAPARRVP